MLGLGSLRTKDHVREQKIDPTGMSCRELNRLVRRSGDEHSVPARLQRPLHQAAHDGQPQPQAAARPLQAAVGLGEDVEEAGEHVRLDANTRVADLEIHQVEVQRLKDFFNTVGARAVFSL